MDGTGGSCRDCAMTPLYYHKDGCDAAVLDAVVSTGVCVCCLFASVLFADLAGDLPGSQAAGCSVAVVCTCQQQQIPEYAAGSLHMLSC